MDIQIDSREHKRELERVRAQLERAGAHTFISKLYVGDYMSLDNPRLVVDRKKDLGELSGNVCQQHTRFRSELVRAQEAGIQIVILCEHGDDIKTLEDVKAWRNPRLKYSPAAITGDKLYRILSTMRDKYGVLFAFCNKDETGEEIIKFLKGE